MYKDLFIKWSLQDIKDARKVKDYERADSIKNNLIKRIGGEKYFRVSCGDIVTLHLKGYTLGSVNIPPQVYATSEDRYPE